MKNFTVEGNTASNSGWLALMEGDGEVFVPAMICNKTKREPFIIGSLFIYQGKSPL